MKKRRYFWIALALLLLVPVAALAQTYRVQPGDSLWKIAVRYQVGVEELIGANPQFKDPNLIYPGEIVNVPDVPSRPFEQEVVRLTNIERTNRGLAPLRSNWELSRIARIKSEDMRDRGYFSHQSPTYGSPFQMIRNFGINYTAAAENIAAGQATPAAVVRSWMNSSGHRANILNASMTEIGVGYAQGGKYGHYWTQQFIRR